MMKRFKILIGALLLTMGVNAQTLQSSSIVWNDAGGDEYYLLDSMVYDDGKVVVTRTANMDSTTMDAFILADTVSSYSTYLSELASYNKLVLRISTLEAAKSVDSLQQVYYADRLLEMGSMLDSLRQ